MWGFVDSKGIVYKDIVSPIKQLLVNVYGLEPVVLDLSIQRKLNDHLLFIERLWKTVMFLCQSKKQCFWHDKSSNILLFLWTMAMSHDFGVKNNETINPFIRPKQKVRIVEW